jgi:hypothetical protein
VVIVVEVVHDLPVLDTAEVDITSLGGPLQVEKLRVNILVFKPPFIV